MVKTTALDSYTWYISDWRGSKTRLKLSSAGKGMIRELFDYCWEVGFLPVDDRMLLAISAGTAAEFKREWPIMREAFYLSEDGSRWLHGKVQEKREKLVAWRESRIENAKKPRTRKASGLASASENDANKLALAIALAEPLPSSSFSSLRSETTPPQRTRDFEPFDGADPEQLIAEAVESCAMVWPKIGDKRYAKQAWALAAAADAHGISAWCEKIKRTVMDHAPAHKAAKALERSHFIPTLEKWVSSGDYTSPPPAVIPRYSGPIDLGEKYDGRT